MSGHLPWAGNQESSCSKGTRLWPQVRDLCALSRPGNATGNWCITCGRALVIVILMYLDLLAEVGARLVVDKCLLLRSRTTSSQLHSGGHSHLIDQKARRPVSVSTRKHCTDNSCSCSMFVLSASDDQEPARSLQMEPGMFTSHGGRRDN